jgi:peptidoglycan/LPS O-acetylase OafA/YrhL
MKRIQGFDGLRALAVTSVFVAHMRTLDINLAATAVYLFFVLSGFLITGILTDQRRLIEGGSTNAGHEMLGFYYRRSLRIFPIYYLVLFAYALWIRSQTGDGPAGLWSFVTYVSNLWMLTQDECHVLLCHFWSLAIEEQFYVILAPLLLLVPSRRHLAVVGTVYAIGMASLVAASVSGVSFHAQYWLSSTNFSLLAAGGLVSLLSRSRPDLKVGDALAAAAAIVVVAYVLFSNPARRHAEVLYLSMFALTVPGLALIVAWVSQRQTSVVVRVLSWKPLAYLGTVSYGFYLMHPAIIHAYRGLVQWPDGSPVPKFAQSALSAVVCFSVTFLLSHLSWQFFEKRVLRLRDAAFAGPPARTKLQT